MEKFIRLVLHLRENNILSPQQYGFVSGRSTSLQLLHLLNTLTRVLDKGREVDVIYMDFQKTFDSVPHERLMAKLEGYGVRDPILSGIRSFLCGRRQRVVVHNAKSSYRPVTSGIPQGSVLGPILFVVYINDLPEAIKSLVYIFADDSKFCRVIDQPEDREILQNDLVEAENWQDLWLLGFHRKKCKAITVSNDGSQKEDAKYKLLGHDLDRVSSEKDLGVIIDIFFGIYTDNSQQSTQSNGSNQENVQASKWRKFHTTLQSFSTTTFRICACCVETLPQETH